MMLIALQTDATRVVTYRLPVCSLLSGMGVKLKAHSLSHYGFSQPRTEASRQRDLKCTSLFAHFLDRLKEAKDLDGSRLYEQCIVSYGTNIRSGHELKNVPALLRVVELRKSSTGGTLYFLKKIPLANYWLTSPSASRCTD